MGYAKSEGTQRRLLIAMAKLLRSKGYSATGLRAVVAESGVPKGSLYHHFPKGKAQLAAAAVRLAGDELVDRIDRLSERSEDPIRVVQRFCDRAIDELSASDFRSGSPISTVALEAGPGASVVQDACAGVFEDLVEAFAQRFEWAGAPRERAEPLATFVVSAVEGALVLAKARRDAQPVEIVREQLTATLTAALTKRRG